MALVGVVGELAAQFQSLDWRYLDESAVVERNAPGVLETVVEHEARVVEFLSRIPQVVHVGCGGEERAEEHGGVPPVGSADGGQVFVLVAVGVAQVQSGLEPFGELVVDLQACGVTFQPAVVDDSLRFVESGRGVVGAFRGGSRNRKVVILVERRARDGVDPVRAGAFGLGVGEGVFRDRRVRLDLVVAVGAREEIGVVVAVAGELRGVHDVELARELRESQIGLEGDAGTSVHAAALLGRDHDHAVRAACAVDGRRRGVLQHRDRLDVRGVDVVQVVNAVDDAVDDDQRFVRCRDRARAADSDRGRGARLSGRGHDVGAGDAALEGLVDRNHRDVLDVAHLDVGHRTRQVGFFHRAVADHDHFVDGLLALVEFHVDLRACADLFGFGFIADVLERQRGAFGNLDRIIARGVGAGAGRRARHQHGRADQRLAALVRNLARYGVFGSAFLREGRRCRQRSRNQQDQ